MFPTKLQLLFYILSFILLLQLTNTQTMQINDNADFQTVIGKSFKYDVYCPIPRTTKNYQNFYLTEWQKMAYKQLSTNQNSIDKYVISMRMKTDSSGKKRFHFCSLARKWSEPDCSNARIVCSSPGPMFYIPKGAITEVAWIHNIETDPNNLPPTFSSSARQCVIEKADLTLPSVNYSDPSHCTLGTRKGSQNTNSTNQIEQMYKSCTFEAPTKMSNSNTMDMNQSSSTLINEYNIPVSIHIHGLQVRPTFDGNPMSFMTTDGSKGLGYFSLTNQKYYGQFKEYTPTDFTLTAEQQENTKVNRYTHYQPAGHIWYHDHSMHATNYNVRAGLVGIYMIYDQQIEALLPTGQNQLFFTVSEQLQVIEDNDITFSPTVQHHGFKLNPPEYTFSTNMDRNLTTANYTFKRNSTYRIKLLNAIYDSIFSNLVFATDCNINPNDSGSKYIPPDSCNQILNFSIIGTDSAYFHQPIHNVTKIPYLSSAERLEILIIFDGEVNGQKINPIGPNIKKIYMLSHDTERFNSSVAPYLELAFTLPIATKGFYVRMQFDLESTSSTNQFIAPNMLKSLPAPYYNLSKITQNCKSGFDAQPETSTLCISAYRNKPFFIDSKLRFYLNGHYDFHSGASDNPQIGTTEDWFLINTMAGFAIPHPIHIHLINFQVIEEWSLKVAFDPTISLQTCTYYELDFLEKAGVFTSKNQNITLPLMSKFDKCLFLKKSFDISKQQNIYNNYLQNIPTTSANVYGLDVFTKMNPFQASYYNDSTCKNTNSQYKYLCIKLSKNQWPEWYTRWKDTVLTQPGTMVRIRIRWASVEYDPAVKPYPYFNVAEDELIQFPGFVYHCHFISHEDDELMRSFMMQPSTYYKSLNANKSSYENCLKNNGVGNGEWESWANKYKCINQMSGCLM